MRLRKHFLPTFDTDAAITCVAQEVIALTPSGSYPGACASILLALRQVIRYIPRRIARIHRLSPQHCPMGENPPEDVLDIVGRYVGIVARHGFDSAKAAEFRAAHHHNMAFRLRAAAHDRMLLRKYLIKEAERCDHQLDWDSGF